MSYDNIKPINFTPVHLNNITIGNLYHYLYRDPKYFVSQPVSFDPFKLYGVQLNPYNETCKVSYGYLKFMNGDQILSYIKKNHKKTYNSWVKVVELVPDDDGIISYGDVTCGILLNNSHLPVHKFIHESIGYKLGWVNVNFDVNLYDEYDRSGLERFDDLIYDIAWSDVKCITNYPSVDNLKYAFRFVNWYYQWVDVLTGKDIDEQSDLFNKHCQRYCVELYEQCIKKHQTNDIVEVCNKLIETVAEIVDDVLL